MTAPKSHKLSVFAWTVTVTGVSMTQPNAADQAQKQRIRALRRARRYLRANQGALARVLNTYARVAELDPARRFLPDQ
ncbi:hypothetical protein [uncultured Tateyamaria sp.]|uniref:hypothetical protein n=1 Tax=Tateyamaria sp. 1078 TaxID=3417464 RepID=UPI00260E69F0|nr:hypothetical protein [uncultured Tateyamaria sp.]